MKVIKSVHSNVYKVVLYQIIEILIIRGKTIQTVLQHEFSYTRRKI